MPIYEYECRKCGLRFERKQGILEDPINVCPQCDGATRRVIQPVGIVFKTGGFYITDNRPSPKDGDETKSTSRSSPRDGDETKSTSRSSPRDGDETKSTSRSSPKDGDASKPAAEVAAAKTD